MVKRHTIKEVKLRLQAIIDQNGSLRAGAKALGVSAPYLSDVMLDKRAPGKKILVPLKMVRRGTVERKVWYEGRTK